MFVFVCRLTYVTLFSSLPAKLVQLEDEKDEKDDLVPPFTPMKAASVTRKEKKYSSTEIPVPKKEKAQKEDKSDSASVKGKSRSLKPAFSSSPSKIPRHRASANVASQQNSLRMWIKSKLMFIMIVMV